MAWPTKNERNAVASETTRATRPNTATLATSTCGRRGAAAKVARTVPVPNSALITSTPSTPTASWQKNRGIRLVLVGSNPSRVGSGIVAQCARVSPVARAAIPMPTTTVMPSVHMVERTVRSLVHSDLSRPARS